MRVTIKDVAREAGVAVSTVSRMYNSSGPVSPTTGKRIKAAAHALGYVPNASARSLITNKTATLGVLLPGLYGEFYAEVIRGIDQTAQQHGYHVLVSSSHYERHETEAALRVMRGRVDGLIVTSQNLNAASLRSALPANLPVVLLNCKAEGGAFASLNIDNFGGAYKATEHLRGLGHRRIAIITGAPGNVEARERLYGYRAALLDAGEARLPELAFEGDFSASSGYRAARAMLTLAVLPTAVFASNDAMAMGALRAFREAGLDVPQDVALCGFDDIPAVRYLTPPLTSVHVPISELGATAARRLIQAITTGRPLRRQEVIPTRLVLRASCGAPGTPAAYAAPPPEKTLH
jgi:LacI family transcriptional regulator